MPFNSHVILLKSRQVALEVKLSGDITMLIEYILVRVLRVRKMSINLQIAINADTV